MVLSVGDHAGTNRDGGWFARLRRAVAERLHRGGNATAMAKVVVFRGLAMAVNIGTSLLTAAVLGPSGRGEQAALVLAPTFLGGLAMLGLHDSLIYNMKADPAHERELLGNGVLLALFTGVVVMAAGWIAEPYWLQQYSADTIMVGRLLLLTTPLIVVGWVLTGAAEARGWFGLVNGMLYLQSLATLALLGVLALLGDLTPTSSAFAYILPMVLMVLYIFARVARRMGPIFRPRWDLLRRLLRYGLRLYGVDVLGTLANSVDQIIIVAFLPASMVGTYAVALSSARMLMIVQAGISAVLFPSVAAREIGAIVQMVATAFRLAMLLIAGMAAVLMVVGPPVLLLAYGPKFAPAIMPFRILLLAVVVENGARILYQIYSGSGRPGLVTFFEAAAVAVLLLVMLVLVPPLGTLGAALAVLCAAAFRLLVAIGALPVLLRIDLPRLLFGWVDARMVMALLARPRAGAAPAASDPPGLETLP